MQIKSTLPYKLVNRLRASIESTLPEIHTHLESQVSVQLLQIRDIRQALQFMKGPSQHAAHSV